MKIEKLKSSMIGILCCLVLVLATTPLNSSLDVKAFPSPFLVAESFGTGNTVYDFNGDGKVDLHDIALAAKQYTGETSGIADSTVLDPLEAWSEAELIIWQYNSTHYGCRNMSTLMALAFNTNLTLVEQWALGNMTSGLLWLKGVQHNSSLTIGSTEMVMEEYQGSLKYYKSSSSGKVGDCPTRTNSTFVLADSLAEQTLLEISPSGVTKVYNCYFDLSALTQNITIQVYSKIDGTNYRVLSAFTLSNMAPDGGGIVLKEIMVDTAFKITITSTVAEGATRNIVYRYFTEAY